MRRLSIGLVVLSGLAACSQPAAPPAPEPIAAVRTAVATLANLDETVTAYGAAEFDPAAVRALTAPFEAQVAAVHVAVGQSVAAGQPVVTLTPSPATQLDLSRLAREAAQASRDVARLRRLRADGLASDAEVEASASAAATAEQASRSLGLRAGGGVLRAPAAAVVDSLAVSVGAIVPAGGPVASLGAQGRANARLGLEVEDAQRIGRGFPVTLEAMHAQGARVRTQVSSVDLRVDAATRLAAVLVNLPAGGPFLPGETLRGEITLATRPNAVVVPRTAVLYDGDQPYGFVVSGGKAARRSFRLGLEQGDVIQILQGVLSGDRVVVEGGPALSDGLAVREMSGPARTATGPQP